jgi:hypothetical protein
VDELLAGILKQIRLKKERYEQQVGYQTFSIKIILFLFLFFLHRAIEKFNIGIRIEQFFAPV